MKKALSVLTALAVLMGCMPALAGAEAAFTEETAEYRDEIISFRYPAKWTCGVAYDGSIILGVTGTQSAVSVAALISDMVSYTGDREIDGPSIESSIGEYSVEKQQAKGKNLTLNGEYEMKQVGEMRGFRALGTWLATDQDLVMTTLTANRHLVSVTFIGEEAIALEDALLSTIELVGGEKNESEAGFIRWEGAGWSVNYPEGYGVTEMATGVLFIDPNDTNCIIMARVYNVDFDYSDDLAAAIAAQALPKSTKVEPNAVMEKAGGWNAAVIRGEMSSGPMSFYVIGSGRTILAFLFAGEAPVGMAETIVSSAVID